VELSFHTGVQDTLGHTRQLVLKGLRRGWSVAVVGPVQVLDPLDRYLWVADPQDFLPHVVAQAGDEAVAKAILARSPVVLVDRRAGWPSERPAPALVIDLHAAETPPQASSSAPMAAADDAAVDWAEWPARHRVEVIGVSPSSVQRGRVLWRQAQQQGLGPRHVSVGSS
jgi:DNA polymerase IIIc chi subunit